MNGVHDMGGMHGFRPVKPEPNEPVFHAPWEGRVLALRRAVGAWRRWNIDVGRHTIETLPPADYLRLSYYEKWLKGRRSSWCSARASSPSGSWKPAIAIRLCPSRRHRSPPTRCCAGDHGRRPSPGNFGQAAFHRRTGSPGARHQSGRTPAPAALGARTARHDRMRSRCARVSRFERQVRGRGTAIPLTVRFEARELWGEAANPADAVYLDLWEDYLDVIQPA